MQPAGSERIAERLNPIGKQYEGNRGRQSESKPCRERTDIASAGQTNRDPDLAAGRSWQELTQSHKVSVGLFVEPAAANDKFIVKIAEMRDRAAETGQSEAQERTEDLETGSGLLRFLADLLVPHGYQFTLPDRFQFAGH